MNILFICNTNYQLIMSLQMRFTIFKDDVIYIFISDHIKGGILIQERLRNSSIVEDVYYGESKSLIYGHTGKIQYFKDSFKAATGIRRTFWGIPEKLYIDRMFYYNADIATYTIYSSLYNNNRNMKCSRFEEGMLSYNVVSKAGKTSVFNGRVRAAEKMSHFLNKHSLEQDTDSFYAVYPELYNGKLNTFRIPKIDTNGSELKSVLKYIYSIGDEVYEDYKDKKYIYFACTLDFEGANPIGEIDLIKQVCTVVGKDNVVIKIHPRDDEKRFINEGLTVARGASIPWEAIQLNGDFSDKIFLATLTQSVLGVNPLLVNPIETYYLYNLVNFSLNELAVGLVENLEKAIKCSNFDFIHVPNSLEDFEMND